MMASRGAGRAYDRHHAAVRRAAMDDFEQLLADRLELGSPTPPLVVQAPLPCGQPMAPGYAADRPEPPPPHGGGVRWLYGYLRWPSALAATLRTALLGLCIRRPAMRATGLLVLPLRRADRRTRATALEPLERDRDIPREYLAL